MDTNTINTLIKIVGTNLCISYIYVRIINFKKLNFSQNFFLITFILLTSILQLFIENYTSKIFRLFFTYIIYGFMLSKLTDVKINKSFILTTLSIAIYSLIVNITAFIISIVLALVAPIYYKSPLTPTVILVFTYLIIHIFFSIKRLKKGFGFIIKKIDNSYMDTIFLALNIIILFSYFILSISHSVSTKQLGIILFILTIIMLIALPQTLIAYHKQKLQTQALKDYEQQLSETKQKLSTALEEKQLLIKSNHEFHHRQEALMKKLDNLATQYSLSTNTEFGEDYGNLLSRINNLTSEYVEKTKSVQNLPKTNIEEIDDMLEYMKSECNTNHIEFNITIDCDINYIIDNFITKSQLETLLGDLIRNSIIAINHSNEPYRSIMLVFGIRDSFYELCIYDSGIPFKVETLVNFGIKSASTHTDEGGTGIGLLTTFETINSSNASLIIDENTHTNYTKSIKIKFDKKHEYIICTNRSAEITEKNTENRNILLRS